MHEMSKYSNSTQGRTNPRTNSELTNGQGFDDGYVNTWTCAKKSLM